MAQYVDPSDAGGEHSRRVTIEALVGSRIVSADGAHIGTVVEIRVSRGPEYRVIDLLYGRYGWLDRLNVLRLVHGKYRPFVRPKSIPWEAVASYEHFTVRLRPGFDMKQAPA